METITKLKKVPALASYESLEDKFNAICEYLEIDTVLCVIPDLTDFIIPPPLDKKFYVADILGPRPNYIKSLLIEWKSKLEETLDGYLNSDRGFGEITTSLQKLKKRCEELVQENNPHNELKYKGDFSWQVEFNGETLSIPAFHLDFAPMVYEILDLQLNLRRNFYIDFFEILTDKLIWHLSIPGDNQRPYSWDSENAELEISELIYVLHILAQRISINKEAGGSFPKLRKQLFSLFGLDDTGYSKKIDQVLKRKKNEHFVQELAEKLTAHNAKLFEVEK